MLLENESVRVLDTRIEPGDTVPLHTHRWPSVLHVLGWSDFVRRNDRGDVVVDTRAQPLPAPPSVVWSPALPPHTLENVGTTPIHVVSIEIKQEPVAHDEQAIRHVHARWIEAVNAGDLPRLSALMTDDAVFVNPGQAPVDRAGFASNFSQGHEHARIQCGSELEEVVVAGDVAYTRSRDTLSVTPRAGGEDTTLAGYRVTVYRRQADGRWLLARDAHTLGAG